MELFDTMVKIDLASLIIKHMQMVLLKNDKKAHDLPWGFWFAQIFEEYAVSMQVWSLQTTKDILGRLTNGAHLFLWDSLTLLCKGYGMSWLILWPN